MRYEKNYEQLSRYMLNCVFGGYDFDFSTLCLALALDCIVLMNFIFMCRFDVGGRPMERGAEQRFIT